MQYINYIIVWGNTDKETYEKERTLVPILLKAGFVMKPSKVKVLAQEIQFAGIK